MNAATSTAHADTGSVYADLAHLMRQEGAARGLSLLARQPRNSVLAGQHGSRLRGRGLDFEELRRYLPGDDLRQLDRRASLRYGKPYVRSYSEERDRPALIVVDQRMSMFFGSVRAFKSVVAAEAAALLAWMMLHAGDRVGGVVLDDSRVSTLRPLRSRERVQALCALIADRNQALSADAAHTGAGDGLNQSLQAALALSPHDSLVCIVSDFAGADDATLKLLRLLAAHNDVLATLVYDPLALRLPARGRPLLTQGEWQMEVPLGRQQVRQPLEAFFTGRFEAVARLLRLSGLPLLSLDTAGETLAQLRRELGRQADRSRP